MISPTSYSIHMLGMKCGIHQYVPSPIATVIMPKIVSNIDANVASDDSNKIEQLYSEELECESKEEEEEEIKHVLDINEHIDLNKCEFLVNLQVGIVN